jgi:hypothetical protein
MEVFHRETRGQLARGRSEIQSRRTTMKKIESTRKQIASSIVLGGLMATLLLGVPVFQGRRSGIVPKVHAQENDEHRGCSSATLNGVYGFYRSGTTSDGPLAAVGLGTFDGTGAVSTARQTIRRNGVTTSDLFVDPPAVGPYEVDPDCAGRFLAPDGSVRGHFVVVDGGKEIFNISLSPGNSVTGVFRKINSHRDHEED